MSLFGQRCGRCLTNLDLRTLGHNLIFRSSDLLTISGHFVNTISTFEQLPTTNNNKQQLPANNNKFHYIKINQVVVQAISLSKMI